MLTTFETVREAGQSSRLGEVLPKALAIVPLYQNSKYPPFDDNAEPADFLRKLPFITKSDLRRDFPHNFLREEADLDALVDDNLIEIEHTSGTSEPRASLLLRRGWWKEQEESALRLNGFVASVLDEFPDARRVTINSPVCAGDICYSSIPGHSERIVGNNLFVNLTRYPFLWSEADLERMAKETVEWQPVFLDVDPVYGALFAQYCERNSVRLPSLRFIICSYEFVSVVHRRILERVFGVPIFNLYGATETGHLLMQNERGEMLSSAKTAFLEVVGEDADGIGNLVVTTLTNDYMPLVRYRIGDLVEKHENAHHTTFVVHGRERDAFTLSDGTRLTTSQVDECFAGLGGFTHYQLTQQLDDAWLLRFVADGAGPAKMELAELHARLMRALKIKAASELEIQSTDILMAEPSGKFLTAYPLRQSF